MDKRRQYPLAERYGMRCSKTLTGENHEALLGKRNEIAYPAIVKPAYSHQWWPIFQNKAIAVENPSELERTLEIVAPSGLAVV